MTNIGFIGLGHMGNPMATNLLKAKHSLYVYDVMPQSVKALQSLGAIACDSVAEVCKQTEMVITMVQTSQQVKSICLGSDGIFAHVHSDALYIDSSSIDINETQNLHLSAKEAGIAMLDAPVSGGVAGATAATLTFMVGGEEKNFNRAHAILQNMGKRIIHAGPAGRGQAAKICNNLLLGISMIGVCEAFNLAEELGLDTEKFFEISSNASGQCWSMTSYCPVPGILENVPANNDYKPGFTANMMLKDLRLAESAAENVNAALPLGSLAMELYTLYVNHGFSEKDFSGIINFLKKNPT